MYEMIENIAFVQWWNEYVLDLTWFTLHYYKYWFSEFKSFQDKYRDLFIFIVLYRWKTSIYVRYTSVTLGMSENFSRIKRFEVWFVNDIIVTLFEFRLSPLLLYWKVELLICLFDISNLKKNVVQSRVTIYAYKIVMVTQVKLQKYLNPKLSVYLNNLDFDMLSIWKDSVCTLKNNLKKIKFCWICNNKVYIWITIVSLDITIKLVEEMSKFEVCVTVVTCTIVSFIVKGTKFCGLRKTCIFVDIIFVVAAKSRYIP